MTSTQIPITDIVGRPGATRAWDEFVVAEDIEGLAGALMPQAVLVGDVQLDLDLDTIVEGILVRGTVEFDLDVPCSRCLTEIRLEPTVHIAELYTLPGATDEEADADEDVGYELDEDADDLDLGPLLLDLLAMEQPVRILCQDDCAGLCVVCGQDLNDEDCGHRPDEDTDPRWAALATLDLN